MRGIGPLTTLVVLGSAAFIGVMIFLADADAKTQFFALVGTFVVGVLFVAVVVTLVMAILYLAGFKSLGHGAIHRHFALFMAWTLLRSHRRKEPFMARLGKRMEKLRRRPRAERMTDVIVSILFGGLLLLSTEMTVYNTLTAISSGVAVAIQIVLTLLAAIFGARAFPRSALAVIAIFFCSVGVALLWQTTSEAGVGFALPSAAKWALGIVSLVVATALSIGGLPARFRQSIGTKVSRLGRPFKTRLTLQPFVSIVGVSLGIWALIVVLSVMRGFATDLQTKILRTNAHITVEPRDSSGVLSTPFLTTDAIRSIPGVREIQAMAHGEVMMSSSSSVAINVVVKGMTDSALKNSEQLRGSVEPGHVQWLWHPEYLLSDRYRYPLAIDRSALKGLKSDPEKASNSGGASAIEDLGSMDPFAAGGTNPGVDPGILLGAELAKTLNVSVGSEINVISPDGDFGPTGLRPKLKSFRVAGIFTTGMYEYDQKLAYMTLDDAQRFLNLDRSLNRLEIRLDDPDATDRTIRQVTTVLADEGTHLKVMSWRERNKSLFAALALERIAMFIILGLTIIVAALSILSSLTMIVVQRARDIAVLKALGASNSDIVRTFMAIGGVIGFIATGTGLLIGLVFIVVVKTFGVPLPREYYITTLPVAVDPIEVAFVALVAMAICMAFTWYPARAASRLSPVEGFRHG